jgi:hypothetical protein
LFAKLSYGATTSLITSILSNFYLLIFLKTIEESRQPSIILDLESNIIFINKIGRHLFKAYNSQLAKKLQGFHYSELLSNNFNFCQLNSDNSSKITAQGLFSYEQLNFNYSMRKVKFLTSYLGSIVEFNFHTKTNSNPNNIFNL